MSRRSVQLPASLTRRTTLRSVGVVVAVLGLGRRLGHTSAQEATPGSAAATPMADGEFVTINGADLYYEVHGPDDGPPVLLLHGDIGNTEEFDKVVPALVSAGYRTVAFDQRGRGRSTWGDRPITYEQMANDALALLDYLGIDRTNVVGWSAGAILALELAIHDPERLGRVVVYGGAFAPDGVYAEPQPSDQLPPFEKFVEDYQRLSPEPERFEELLQVLGELATVAPNYSEDELGSITVPVLVLDGAKEEFIKPEHTKRLAELIPGAELVIMPDTGHMAPFARPEEFNQIVLDYLAGKTPAAQGTPLAVTPTS